MYIIKGRMTARLLRCLLLLMLVLLVQHCQAETVSVTGSFSTTEKTYANLIYDVTGLSGETDTAIVGIFSPVVTEGGVYFKGFSSYALSQAAPAMKLNVTDATVTNAPIKISGCFPPGSTTNVSGTKAKMLGDTILFDFRTLVPRNKVMFYVVNTVAEWTTLPGGVVLALVDEKVRVLIEEESGFYLYRINATGAMSMVKLYGEICSGRFCLDVYNGQFAIDYANCTNCNGPFFDAGIHTVANSKQAMTRFLNCTHQTGQDQPFFYANPVQENLFIFSTDGNFIMSAITTDGDLFSVPNKRPGRCAPDAQLLFQHIKAKGHGLGWTFFYSDVRSCDVYVGNLTFDGDKYTEPSQYAALNIEYSKIIDDFGNAVYNARTAADTSEDYSPSLAYCMRRTYKSVSSTEFIPSDAQNAEVVAMGFPAVPQWNRSRCACKDGTFEPYCNVVFDPLFSPLGYTFVVPTCETDPVTCKLCRWDEWDVCGECNPGYKFNNKGECVPKGCSVDNCQTCVFDDEDTCETCELEYKLSGSSCARKTCAQVPCLGCEDVSGNGDVCTSCKRPYALNSITQQCDACEPGYKWNAGTSQCDPKQCNVANCQACVFDEEHKCQTCDDKYKVSDSSCVQKTCAKLPCSQCTSDSGNTDVCTSCGHPYTLNPITRQCDACVAKYKYNGTHCIEKTCTKSPCLSCDNDSGNSDTCSSCKSPYELSSVTLQCDACESGYKLVGSSCVKKTCTKSPCMTCENDSGVTDVCTSCQFPFAVNPITRQCDTCESGYKFDGSNCVKKTCSEAPCSGCENDSGDTDICTSCDAPFAVNPNTHQCDACEPGLKFVKQTSTCVEKGCLVENCDECVFDQEYQCNSCGGDLTVDGNSQCSAASEEGKMATGELIGIIVGVVAIVLLIVFFLVFFLCRRKRRRRDDEVVQPGMSNTGTGGRNNGSTANADEDTKATLLKPEREDRVPNPLLPTEQDF